MSKELSPKYNPAEVEAGRYQKWLDEDVFKPSGDKKAKPYSIVIPPPNVTGKLHLGHAWANVFRGKTVLLPCDDPEWSNFTKYFAQNFEEYT